MAAARIPRRARDAGPSLATVDSRAGGPLCVGRDLLDRQGAASHADVALAVTGLADRGAPGDEAGPVHFACMRRGTTRHPPPREAFRRRRPRPTRVKSMHVAPEMLEAAL